MREYEYQTVFHPAVLEGTLHEIEDEYRMTMGVYGCDGWEIFQVVPNIEHLGARYIQLHMRRELL